MPKVSTTSTYVTRKIYLCSFITDGIKNILIIRNELDVIKNIDVTKNIDVIKKLK